MTTAEIITYCRNKTDFVVCEYCNRVSWDEPVMNTLGRHNYSYCSDGCRRDDEEEYRVGQREAAREFEMYGSDYDSWYR